MAVMTAALLVAVGHAAPALTQRYMGRFAYDFGWRSLNTPAVRSMEQQRLPEAWDPVNTRWRRCSSR